MPIRRTYACENCGHFLELEISSSQIEMEAPECPACNKARTVQEFRGPAIVGSARSRAVKIAERIAEEDYGVANMHVEGHEGVRNKVTYKDQPTKITGAGWTGNREAIEAAASIGRQTRMEHGSGLDILQKALKTGDQPDLIKNSVRRMREHGSGF